MSSEPAIGTARGLAIVLAVALLPAHASAQGDNVVNGAQARRACDPLDFFAARCAFVGSGSLPGRGGYSTERSPWTVPGLPSSVVSGERASYPFETGGIRVVPTVVYVPDPEARVPGVVSVGLERAAPGDPLRLRGELGWSGRPGGSFDLAYRGSGRNASLKAEQRPAGAAALPDARAPGQSWNGAWSERLGPSAEATLVLSNDRLELQDFEPQSTSGRIDVRYRAADGWKLVASVAGSSYSDATHDALTRGIASLGTEVRAGVFNLAATVRDVSSSSSAVGGRGGRVSLRSSLGGWDAGLYADAQQNAATLELDASGGPDVPQRLVEFGLAGASPENAVRMLRDAGPLLVQHDLQLGALRVDPMRVQGGLDIRWRDHGRRGTEVGVLLAMDDLQGSDTPRRALLGQLRVSWRVFGDTDLSASYATWSLQSDAAQDDSRSQVRLLLKSTL